jgi:hypothetical protein
LLRELEILSQQQSFATVPSRVFALAASNSGSITVCQGETASDVDPLVLLDEDLAQADRYMAAEG